MAVPDSAARSPAVHGADAERLRALLRYAVRAPSRHNSQPWAFEIAGPELRIYGDWRRHLRVADPQGRELVMACGAATQNVELAARRFGRSASVEVVAGSRKDGLLARLTLEEPCVATPAELRLFEAIPERGTNRFAYDPRELPPGTLPALARHAAALGVRVRAADETLRAAVGELVAEGDRLQWANPRFRAELAAWSRSNDPGLLDGMPGFAHGLSDPASAFHGVSVWMRGTAAEERRGRQHARGSRALLALCTDGDGPADWFAAGRAMQRAWLEATVRGLSASCFSEAVAIPSIRERLREALGERGWPQLLFRLGFGGEVQPTPRRPVRDVLRALSPDPPPHALARPAGGAAPLGTRP